MINPAAYRASIVGIAHEIHLHQQRLCCIKKYLAGNYNGNTTFRSMLSMYNRGIDSVKAIERLKAIKADMQMQLEVYYHRNKIKAA